MKNAKKTILWLFLMVLLAAVTVYLAVNSGKSAGTPATSGTYTPGTYTAAAQGMGEVKVNVTVDGNSITKVELDVSNETEGIGQAAADTLIEQVMAAQSSEIDGVSGSTLTSTAVKTAVADCLTQAANSSIFTPGTYTATATGMGEVKVNVTVDANSITTVELDVSNETKEIGQAAADTLKEQVIAAQGSEIDGVSGATLTSTAVKTAVADCLIQATSSSAG